MSAVAAGDCHTCAVKASGQLVCFGANEDGQCDTPADLGPVIAVAAGSCHTCAIKASGQLVCFGDNADDRSVRLFRKTGSGCAQEDAP